MCRQVEGDPVPAGQDSGILQVAETVGQHARGDDDQRQCGAIEEHTEVEFHRLPIQQPAQDNGGGESECGTDQRCEGGAGCLDGGPDEQRRFQPLAAHGEEGGDCQCARADRGGPGDLAAQLAREGGGGTPHPEHHRGHQADRGHTQYAADDLLTGIRQHIRGVGEDSGEGRGDRYGAEHTEPYRSGGNRAFGRRGLAYRGQQDRDDESGFQALSQADQQVGYSLGPVHRPKVRHTFNAGPSLWRDYHRR